MIQASDTNWETPLIAHGHGSPPHQAVEGVGHAHFPAPPTEGISCNTDASTCLVDAVECQPPYAVTETDTSSKHPLSSFPFFGKFGDKKMTRGLLSAIATKSSTKLGRWPTSKETRPQA